MLVEFRAHHYEHYHHHQQEQEQQRGCWSCRGLKGPLVVDLLSLTGPT